MSPKILIFDIETSPILGYAWGLFDQNIGLNQIHTDWNILSWAAKWAGSKEVLYRDLSTQKDKRNDKPILSELWNLLDTADIVVTQNGKAFDQKRVNSRFILHGMQPPSSYKHIDTLRLAKKHFGFTSNKLAYLTDKLCSKYKKLTKREFDGFELWKECLAGNKRAWAEMKRYNVLDVMALEELYMKLIPWDSSINFALYSDNQRPECTCGSNEMEKKGFYYTATGKFQRYRCMNCGSQTYSGRNLLTPLTLHKGVVR